MIHARRRGFTLVELMVTVAIVGIIAVIAVVAYRTLITSSHTAEANQVLASIKTQQDRYKAETGQYLNVSGALALGSVPGSHGVAYPACGHPGKFKTAWGAPCAIGSCCNVQWTKLGVTVDSPVFYGYSTVAGGPADTIPAVSINNTAIAWPNPPTDAWFVASAVADTNGDGVYTTSIISSFDNAIAVDHPND